MKNCIIIAVGISCKGVGMFVALFGGSFNPPHQAHVSICSWLLNHEGADRVWVIPCYEHPFGKDLAPFDDRIRMCQLAFKQFGGQVEISDVERGLGGVSYTVRTVEHLVKENPEIKFTLVVGGDIDSQKDEWRDYDRLEKMVPIIGIPRGKGSHIPDISATDVRARIEAGRSIEGLVPPEVAVFIVSHRLYQSPKTTEEAE